MHAPTLTQATRPALRGTGPWLRSRLAAALLCTSAFAALAEEPAAPPQTLPVLATAIGRTLQAAGVPGAAVLVIERGQVVLAIGHGVADRTTGREATPDTVFRAGSISKTFTAMAALALVEDGRLSLQTPMVELLPEWAHDNPWAATDPVRLVHLLEHSAGLDDVRYRHYLLNSATLPLAQALPAFGPYAARWQPGSGTAYSNAGPVVAGRAIERAAGSDFATFVTTRLTAPLGMASARWTRSEDIAARLAHSYGSDGRTPEPFVETPARPSGSLNISARDLARLPRLLLGRGTLDGVRVLDAASVARMEHPATGATAGGPGPVLGWGPGLQADLAGRAVFYGHDGSIDGFVARFAYAPALGAGYVVMANALSDAPLAVAAQVRAYLERGLPAPPAGSQPVSADERQAWAGQYQSITPRQELLRGLIGLTQWEGAGFDGDVLRYAGRRWHHRGQGVFQAEGAAAPGLVFRAVPKDGGGMQAHTQDGSRRRVPGWEAALKQGSLGTLAIALPLSLLMAPLWAWAAWRGRFGPAAQRRGALAVRLLPAAALWAAVAVPVAMLALLGTADLAWLGRPTAAGWALAALGLLAPLLWLAGAAGLLRNAAPRRARLHAALHLLLAALLLGWMGAHGWLGLRIWA
ncbi:MAG: serine hydrolase domain-containing protein [Rubrivivax sp.]|nr:serine hydrolase domain-containing protein [Rubrivivax sp.]